VTRHQIHRDPVDGFVGEHMTLVTPHIPVKKSPRMHG